MFNRQMANQPGTIEQVTYTSEIQGPRLLILGGVHGNETCGPIAIRRIIAEFRGGLLALSRGQVSFVPVCNPEAMRLGVRFIERNLNRFLVPMEHPDTYEARLGNILCPLLERCDALLDIHSYSAGDVPFVSVGRPGHAAERAFCEALGAENMSTGWEDAHTAAGRKLPENPDEPTGTTEYARRFGAIAATLECGQHKAADAPEIAYTAIRNTLRHLALVDEPLSPQSARRLVRMQTVIYKEREGKFAKPWKNFDAVSAGEAIGIYDDGVAITAPEDGYIIMPDENPDALTGWYYFGV